MTNEQVLQKMQRAGFNVTTCGNCGAIKLHELGESELTCDECRWTSDICDFPDLYTVEALEEI